MQTDLAWNFRCTGIKLIQSVKNASKTASLLFSYAPMAMLFYSKNRSVDALIFFQNYAPFGLKNALFYLKKCIHMKASSVPRGLAVPFFVNSEYRKPPTISPGLIIILS